MKRIFLIVAAISSCLAMTAQTVTFTGIDTEGQFVELDRVIVINHTKGWHGMMLYADTVLTKANVEDIADYSKEKGIEIYQNNPNPFEGTTEVCLTIEEGGDVQLVMVNVKGMIETAHAIHLEAGTHRFQVTAAGKGTHLFAAIHQGKRASLVMFCKEIGYTNRIDYYGFTDKPNREVKAEPTKLLQAGDEMEYIGYALINGTEISAEVTQTLSDEQTVTFVYDRKKVEALQAENEPFRVALSLSPFSLNQFEEGYTFQVGDQTASTPSQLQSIYRSMGSTEMYVRIATKRHRTYNADGSLDNTVDGKKDENANVHTFDQALELCRIAQSLNIPINPEIMCAYTYMDMDKIQAPRFEEYPDIYALQNGKKWEELSLNEILVILEKYGEFVADSILATGCTVRNWNLGNEANFGFAGIGMGQPTAVDSKLGSASAMKRYTSAIFGVWWLKKHVWKYEAQTLAALKRGILKAYNKASIDASNVKFSTHIATVVFTPRACASFFRYMASHGYAMETAGISYYPSAPAMSFDKKKLLTKTVTRINKKCGIPVFIGEFSYPSGPMDGPFAGWNQQLDDYEKTPQGQADIYTDVIAWGKMNGVAGIRYWAPDYKGWYSMAMFDFTGKKGTAKTILLNHKNIVRQ